MCLFCLGGRDRKGIIFLTILKNATEDDVNIDNLKKVVLYLASTRRYSITNICISQK